MSIVELTRTKGLSDSERKDISILIHHAIVCAITRSARWKARDLVFQGGTSLKMAWNSPRWSEDLDFLLSKDRGDELDSVMTSVCAMVETFLARALPGSRYELRMPKSRDQKLLAYSIVWSNPARRGNVHAKVEFYTASAELISAYGSEARSISLDQPHFGDRLSTDRAATATLADLNARVQTVIPVASLLSVFCDKILAVGFRPYLKYRDIFDLGFLVDQYQSRFRRAPYEDPAFLHQLSVTSGLYSRTARELDRSVSDWLQRPEPGDKAAFASDMARWLPEDMNQAYLDTGYYEKLQKDALQSVSGALQTLREAIASGPASQAGDQAEVPDGGSDDVPGENTRDEDGHMRPE